MSGHARTPIWVRAVADPDFREQVIADPLRAMADHPDVTASAEQVRGLEELEPAERREIVEEIVHEIYRRRGPTSGVDHEVRE